MRCGPRHRDFAVACALSFIGAVVAVAVDSRLALGLAAVAFGTAVLCARSVWRRGDRVNHQFVTG